MKKEIIMTTTTIAINLSFLSLTISVTLSCIFAAIVFQCHSRQPIGQSLFLHLCKTMFWSLKSHLWIVVKGVFRVSCTLTSVCNFSDAVGSRWVTSPTMCRSTGYCLLNQLLHSVRHTLLMKQVFVLCNS